MDIDPPDVENLDNEDKIGDDLYSLLKAASSKAFEIETGYTENTYSFEKAANLFEIVKSGGENLTDKPATSDDSNAETTKVDEGTLDKDENSLEEKPKEQNSEISVRDDDELASKNEQSDNEDTENPEISKTDNVGDETQLAASELASDESGDEAEKLNDKAEKNLSEAIDQASYDRGYQAALMEFEATIEKEKNSFLSLANLLLRVGDDYQSQLEQLLRKKITEIASGFIGHEIEDNVEKFATHIAECAEGIICESEEFTLEMNHSDLSILNNYFENREHRFQIIEKPDLRRGEFTLVAGSSGYNQRYEKEKS